jgi:hypothetical protein
LANEYFPLRQTEALALWFPWHEETEQIIKKDNSKDLPDTIDEVEDDICDEVLVCAVTWKSYKIIPQELQFYKRIWMPLPRKCPNQRHKERMARRNPRKLRNRACMKCWIPITSPYNPKGIETIYCEACYNHEIYG